MGDLIDFAARRDARKAKALSSESQQVPVVEPAKRRPDREPVRSPVPDTPPRQAAAQFAWETSKTYAEEYEACSAEEDYQREVLESLAEELEGEREDWARSEEEGWFYED